MGSLKQLDQLLKNTFQNPSKTTGTAHNSDNETTNTNVSSIPCQITMVYYGPHTKIDYDHLVFEPFDEIMVMQQHCGGENLIVFKGYCKPDGKTS